MIDGTHTFALASGFSPFGPAHGVAFVVCMGLLAWAGVAGWRAWVRDGRAVGDAVHRVRRVLIPAVVVIQAANLTYFALPAHINPAESLPLHLCDLAGLLAIAALALPGKRWLSMLLYAWGVGLSTQAFFTPVVPTGPTTFRFHLFFASHVAIVGPAIFLVTSRLYVPRSRDILDAWVLTTIYAGAMIALNMSTGWNYGYVGNTTPVNPTLIDKLGPWPLRIVWLAMIVFAVFCAVTAPLAAWMRAQVRRREQPPAASA